MAVNAPTAKPIKFSTKMLEQHYQELNSFIGGDIEDDAFHEITPNTNVKSNKEVTKALPKIEISKDDLPERPKSLYKLNPHRPKVEEPIDISELVYHFEYTPQHIGFESSVGAIPADYGRQYMGDQLVDLCYQLCRLSVPE